MVSAKYQEISMVSAKDPLSLKSCPCEDGLNNDGNANCDISGLFTYYLLFLYSFYQENKCLFLVMTLPLFKYLLPQCQCRVFLTFFVSL